MAGHDDLGVRVMAILDSAQKRGRADAAWLLLIASTAIAAVAAVAPLQAVAGQPAAPVAVLVSAVPVDPEVASHPASEPAMTSPVVRLSPSPLKRLQRPRKLDPTVSAQVRLKPDTTVSTVTDAQVAQDAVPVGRRMLVLLFDVTSLQPDQMMTVVESAGRWVDADMSNADLVSIVIVGTRLAVVKDFTSSREDLQAALQSPELSLEAAAAVSRAVDAALEPLGDLRFRALATLCNTLAPIQQRKSLLYFSAGMNREAAKDGTELGAATDACRRANVLIYPVDARGLASIPNRDPNSPGGSAGLFRGR